MADKKKSDPDADAKPESDAVDLANEVEDQIDSDQASDAESPEPDVFTPDAVLDPDLEDDLEDNLDDEPAEDPDDLPEEFEPEANVDDEIIVSEPEQPVEPEKIVERVIEKRGGFVPAVIGGIIAAGLGFFVARSDVLDAYLPDALKMTDNSEAITALDGTVTDHTATLAALDKTVSSIKIPDQAPVLAQIEALSKQLDSLKGEIQSQNADLSAQVTALDTRLTKLEKQPVSEGVSDAAIDAYERELTKLQTAIANQRADVESLVNEARKKEADARVLEANAEAAAKVAANRAVVAQLHSALDGGLPYGALLGELTVGGVTVPDVLTASAASGVVTLSALRESFPPAARAALEAARSDGDTKDTSIGSFLERYLGARSVVPREGNDPDAVLSRAEAALSAGHLSDAVSEVSSLPEPAQAAMADWVKLADTRMAAVAAVDTLAQSLKTN